jgi:hypothetical protein
MRLVVVFYHYLWNNKVYDYGTIQYSAVLHRKEDLVIIKQNLMKLHKSLGSWDRLY